MTDYSYDVGAQVALRRFAEELKESADFYRKESARFQGLAEECERIGRKARETASQYPKPVMGLGSVDGGK